MPSYYRNEANDFTSFGVWTGQYGVLPFSFCLQYFYSTILFSFDDFIKFRRAVRSRAGRWIEKVRPDSKWTIRKTFNGINTLYSQPYHPPAGGPITRSGSYPSHEKPYAFTEMWFLSRSMFQQLNRMIRQMNESNIDSETETKETQNRLDRKCNKFHCLPQRKCGDEEEYCRQCLAITRTRPYRHRHGFNAISDH